MINIRKEAEMKKRVKRFKLTTKVDISEIGDRVLLLNLYITQAGILLLGGLFFWFQPRSLSSLFTLEPGLSIAGYGLYLALFAVCLDIVISNYVPAEYTDDGGINNKLFARRPLWHIALICLIVSFSEELLFRGGIQYYLGAYWTALLFTVIHVRYLRHWIPTGLVFLISYGLGLVYEQTGSLSTPILAHFVIDFIMGCLLRYSKEE